VIARKSTRDSTYLNAVVTQLGGSGASKRTKTAAVNALLETILNLLGVERANE
jgi:hypothetical protein